MNRRTLLALAATGPFVSSGSRAAAGGRAIKAIALDAFTVFDPRPIAARAEELFPGRGTEFSAIWRARQFEYTWLRTLTGSYADFWSVTEDALAYAAKAMKLELGEKRRERLMRGFSELRAWPDARAALTGLRDAGVRLVFLSNFTEKMLHTAVTGSGMQSLFEPHLSVDRVRAFKPDARTYRMALDSLKLGPEEIVFAAFAGWDAAGARAFGLPTFWVNRMNAPLEELGSEPDGIGTNLYDLARFVQAGSKARP
jgi:2-haloacid dehalogenase